MALSGQIMGDQGLSSVIDGLGRVIGRKIAILSWPIITEPQISI